MAKKMDSHDQQNCEQTNQKPESGALILRDVRRRLAKAESFEEIKSVRDKAEAVRAYARNARLGLEAQNEAAELKLRVERRAGELLAGIKLHGGDRRSGVHSDRTKLSDLGITHHESTRWQQEASVPEEEFERYVENANHVGVEISSAALLRLARRCDRNGPQAHGEVHQALTRQQTGSPSDDSSQHCASRRLDDDMVDDIFEAIAELKGHREALAAILAPTNSNEHDTPPAQKTDRLIHRYLTEMGDLLARMEELLS